MTVVDKMTGACKRAWVERSFKREMAVGVLLYWLWRTESYFSLTDAALINAYSPAYNTVTMVVLPIVGLAFGVDAFWKQGQRT